MKSSLKTIFILYFSSLAFIGCGKREEESPLAEVDNTAEVEAYYQTFKRIPDPLKAKLESGEITQGEYDTTVAETPNFFTFKTLEDLPSGLDWTNGMYLEEIGSPKAIKGGTSYGALQDFPRTLRLLGPDANGGFRPFILDNTSLQIAHRHPNNTEITEKGYHYFPGIAEEWAIDKERKTVFVKINPKAKWSDGEAITSDDFMFMFFLFQSEYIRAPWFNNWYTDMYTNITKYDDLTFSISVPEVKPDMNARVLELRPMPQHFYKELGNDYVERYQWRFQPTSGPYEIKDENIKKGRSITLTRIKDWWANDLKFWRYRFNYDRIQLNVIRDTNKIWEAFLRGDIYGTVLVGLPEYWYEKLPNNHPLVENGYIIKSEFHNQTPRPTYGLWMNQSKKFLDNQDVRIGINFATNWDRVIKEYFRGDYKRMRTSSDGYGEFSHPTLQTRPFDADKALTYFAKAGFTERGPDGILVNENGERLSFNLSTGYQVFQDMLTILKEEAIKAGLEFRVEVLDGTAGWKKVQEKKHDIAFSAFGVSAEMYPRFWETYHSVNAYDKAFLPDGSVNPDRKIKTQTNNLLSIADPWLDEKIIAYRRSESVEEMMSLAFEMEEFLRKDASFVPGFVKPFYRIAHWRWLQYPEDFNVKISQKAGQYYLSWIDPEIKKEVEAAQKSGKSLGKEINVYDQYSSD